MRVRSWCLSAAAAATLCASLAAGAVSLSPTSVLIGPDGPRHARIRVTAPETSGLALDFQVFERFADGDGERLAPPASAAFELLPPQLSVPPGGSADVTVRWVGASPEESSRSFYLVADQLPVEMEPVEASNDVRFLARIHLPMHVDGGGVSMLQATMEGEDPARHLALSNPGSRYARFASLELRIRQPDGTERAIDGMLLAQLLQTDALLPGGRATLAAGSLGILPAEQVVALSERR